ncbi:T9SS type A sorting domain-containing protein [Maribellus sp. YY47]|uniref:T9SS type A sorting domain-containing protein n=1 Tax=Maribellus sp. YY47 TaxID=2929486 RepID=UPI002000A5F6|nr:T9SS type A sorting domain-containing protein [Maribellus sp. YY47]MCK3683952.1 T9SS type A sorting domain-containing protein [Maribellus sp. YY47]
MSRIILIIGLLCGLANLVFGQQKAILREGKFPNPVCYASGKAEKSFVPPPKDFLLKSGEAKSDIVVSYSGFPDSVKVAFEYAVSIWESILESSVPIHIYVTWSGSLGVNTLASCGPETYYANFTNAPVPDCYYPVAVAEKIASEELNGTGRSDIEASFSNKIDWYYGIDGNTPIDKYDFVTVVLHEIGHGLGFTGFFYVSNGLGIYEYYSRGDFTSFDLLVEQFSGRNLLDTSFFQNASVELNSALISNSLFADSPVAKTNASRPRLYAPNTFDDGSSIYHLNDVTYGTGTANALMTHAIAPGEANHDPGPLTKGIMEDIGWTNLFLHHTPVRDKEQLVPLEFFATVESYYELSSNTFVIYSTDNFTTQDTLLLVATENTDEYLVSYIPGNGTTDFQYYVEVSDIKGRKSTSPWNAPVAVHNVHFGVDQEPPVIEHTPIPYFLVQGDPLVLNAQVDDNLGVDTVYVNYSLNGIEQPSFGLTLQNGIDYSGTFDLNEEGLQDGDEIKYSIVAIDAAVAKNQTVAPASDTYTFKIERIFEPVESYANNFNTESPDFLLADFDIHDAKNFKDAALHSPHPYPSPEEDNKDYNFTTMLKYPVILKEEGAMWFDEVVLVEPGTGGYGSDAFWDYVIVEGSKDKGETWQELVDGYDSGANATWLTNYNASIVDQDSKAVGTEEWYVNRKISLLQNGNFEAGDTILIRFRLYSDPYANGWGWVIDNLRIQQTVSAPVVVLSPGNVNVYPNPFSTAFHIDIQPEQVLKSLQIDVFDSFGRNVYSNFVESVWGEYSEQVDLKDQASGMFLLRVSENGKPVLTKKLIKN